MSISTRNRRGMVYAQSSNDDGGYMTQTFTLRGTYFCRRSEAGSEEKTVGSQAEHVERVLFEFADSVVIGQNDVVVEDGVQHRVETVEPRRTSRSQIVRAQRVDDDVFLRLLRYDAEAIFDGSADFSGYVNALTN